MQRHGRVSSGVAKTPNLARFTLPRKISAKLLTSSEYFFSSPSGREALTLPEAAVVQEELSELWEAANFSPSNNLMWLIHYSHYFRRSHYCHHYLLCYVVHFMESLCHKFSIFFVKEQNP